MKLKALLLPLILASSLLVGFNGYAHPHVDDREEWFYAIGIGWVYGKDEGHAWPIGMGKHFGPLAVKNDKQAVKWYKKVADQGYAMAQYNLGWMYANGRGVLKDDKQATYWYKKAADQGYDEAQHNLILMYPRDQVNYRMQAYKTKQKKIKKALSKGRIPKRSKKAKEYLTTNNISEQETNDEAVENVIIDNSKYTRKNETSSDYIQDLERIKALWDSGVINKDDYETLKKKIIDKL